MKNRIIIGINLACLAMGMMLYGQSYSVTVQSGAKQTFVGFGASQTDEYSNGNLPAAARNQMASAVYTGLHAKILRLWVSSDVSVSSMTNEFYPKYVTDGAISNIVADGVTTLLLAPANGHAAPSNVATYASEVAQFIADLKTHGININVTGLDNEPDNWTATQIETGVKDLRADLDGLGLTNVQIVAPESASANSGCDADIDAMHNDSTAWNSIVGIASHSYNMAATTNESYRTFGKQYWITESSDDGNELTENDNRGSTTSARFLNDMNHKVTHWIFFIGFGYSANISTDQDDATKLLVYDHSTGLVQTNLKYFYVEQLLSTFDYGAVFRSCLSSSEADMPYTYGQKPRINAAAAVNPDGSWGIGIVNDTGVPSNPPLTSYYAALNTNVTVTVSELAGTGNLNFTLYRSKAGTHFVNSGTVTMTNGVITVSVAAKELVCLRSGASGAPAAPSGLSATAVSSSEIDLSWTDNSSNETGFKIQRKTGSGGTYGQIATTPANTTIYDNTGLSASTTYYYEVAATNSSGSSAWSGEASATTSSGGSGSLSGSVAAAAGSYNLTTLGTSDWAHWNGTFIHKASGGTQISGVTQIGGGTYGTWHDASRSITWTDGTPTGSGTGDTNYIWCNGTANSGWTFTVPADTTSRTLHVVCGGPANASTKITAHLSDSSAADYTDTESSASMFTKEYTLTYQAASASQTLTITIIHTGSGSPSCDLIAAWLTSSGGSPPAPPTGLTATAGNAQVILSWNASSGATSYNVYRGTSSGGESGTPIATGVTATGYTNTGLANGSTYYYTVAAVNGAGTSGYSGEASATLAPDAPTGLTATPGNAQVTLSWSASSGATSYNVYRGTSPGGESGTPIATGVTSTGYTNTGLANGTTYYYTVAAVNSGGTSGYSGEASATPSGGSLSGSVATGASSYNLTTLGTSDWAHWIGSFVHKSSGGSQISGVTQIGGGTYGVWTNAARSSVSWTDGTPIGSASNNQGYIWCNGTANSGWTFTVPAGTTSKTLHVLCGGPANATIKITAHLSDSSASDYTDTETSTSLFNKEYTITYRAASASQTLTITLIHTNSGTQSCDLDSAWLP